MTKLSQNKLQNTTINFPSYIFRIHALILLASFFIHIVVELLPIVWIGKQGFSYRGETSRKFAHFPIPPRKVPHQQTTPHQIFIPHPHLPPHLTSFPPFPQQFSSYNPKKQLFQLQSLLMLNFFKFHTLWTHRSC